MRNRKGAVPVIATMLLLVIVSATALVVYAYVSGATVLPDADQHVGKMLEKLKTVQVKGSPNGDFNVSFLNTGSEDIVIDMFYVKDFSGNIIVVIPVNISIGVGETQAYLFDSWVLGNGPWSWYEIYGVTDRGNTVRANLFSFLSGAYELGDRPRGETDSMFNVAKVTVNGTDITTTQLLQNLTYLDGSTFNNDTGELYYNNSASPIDVIEFDFSANAYNIHNADVSHLVAAEGNPSDAYVAKINLHDEAWGAQASVKFVGHTANFNYDTIVLSFGFDMNTAPFNGLNGTVQFYNWVSQKYVTAGNGYWEFSPSTNWTFYGSNFRNFTVMMSRDSLIGPNGEWSILINMTTDKKNVEMKLDYLHVVEMPTYVNAIDTVFSYKLVNIDRSEVTRLLFTTTGTFTGESCHYLFGVYNFDMQAWNYFGSFPGNSNSQTVVEEVSSGCSSYISNSNITSVKISLVEYSPTVQTIRIDQTRLIVRSL